MTQQQVALLELVLVAGTGLILMVVGIWIRVATVRRNRRCTAITWGKVTGHSLRGEGKIAPIVEFETGGRKISCRKKFNGILTVKSTNLQEADGWEDEKGYLHIRMGIRYNMRQLAQNLWPLGSGMEVHFDPDNPKVNYVGIPIRNTVLCNILILTGAGVAALGILICFLMFN